MLIGVSVEVFRNQTEFNWLEVIRESLGVVLWGAGVRENGGRMSGGVGPMGGQGKDRGLGRGVLGITRLMTEGVRWALLITDSPRMSGGVGRRYIWHPASRWPRSASTKTVSISGM